MLHFRVCKQNDLLKNILFQIFIRIRFKFCKTNIKKLIQLKKLILTKLSFLKIFKFKKTKALPNSSILKIYKKIKIKK